MTRSTAAERGDGVAHRCEIDHCRDAGQVLQQDPRGRECDLFLARTGLCEVRERLDIRVGHVDTVLVAEQVLEEHLQRERQVLDVVVGLQRRKTVDGVVAPADGKPALGSHPAANTRSLEARCSGPISCSGTSPNAHLPS
jgi:hypothetical protein